MNLFEDVAHVGPGGHFLKSRSTRQIARSGVYAPSPLSDRHPYEAWVELGRPSMYSAARAKVTEILEGPIVDPLPEDVAAQLDDILRRADAEIRAD
jgi:trimethylamine:corrinoid methyltransferase-like protein